VVGIAAGFAAVAFRFHGWATRRSAATMWTSASTRPGTRR